MPNQQPITKKEWGMIAGLFVAAVIAVSMAMNQPPAQSAESAALTP